MQKIIQHKKIILIILSIVCIVGLTHLAGLVVQHITVNRFAYLSKRIFSENQNDILINFIPLRAQLQGYIQSLPHPVGLYFEYLPSGVSIGVNDKIEVNIASLLKVPLAMGVYKQYEKGSLKKNTMLTITDKQLDSKYGTLWKSGAGARITIDAAVRLALEESDNTASNALLAVLPEGALDEVADYLDIPKTKKDHFITITPKNYSSILRSLYLSAYLTQASSNEILRILANSRFTNLLPAGIPSGIKIAHKVGIYTLSAGSEPVYSDCGIVYAPKRPYIVCIMTSAAETDASQYIVTISKMIYTYIISRAAHE